MLTSVIQYGFMQNIAVGVCDGAVLGELFKHLHEEEQIEQFLQAYENLRKGRMRDIMRAEAGNHAATTLPNGEYQAMRDKVIRLNHENGRDAFAGEDGDVQAVWEVRTIRLSWLPSSG